MLRNIGILAHVDAGKTTLSERLLQHAGAIRTAGSVDAGTAHTDRLAIERRRGISVHSAFAPMDWKGIRVQLIDTPGHADFAAQVEHSLWALDGAIILLSGVEGVQPQTEAVFRAVERAHIPALIFINKLDHPSADAERVLRQARRRLSDRIFPLWDAEETMAALADLDEQAMADYMEGTVYESSRLRARVADLCRSGDIYPALYGSAKCNDGIDALLDAIIDLLPPPAGDTHAPVCGVVFDVEQDPVMGIGAHVRLFSGTLENRQVIQLPLRRVTDYSERTCQEERKITQIRAMGVDGRGTDLGRLTAGEIGCVYGLTGVRVGTVLGDASLLPRPISTGALREPLMMVSIRPASDDLRPALHQALEALSAEDPLLDVRRYRGVEHIRVMGAIQLEVLAEQFHERFGLDVTFGDPEVIYRETIRQPAEGFVAYLAPKPCWAVIKFYIEPLPRGSGIEYRSITPVRRVKERYQHQIEQALPLALSQGMLGWQVDDVRITLEDGEDHQFHTHPLDFIVATPMALMDGLRRGGSQLLEPIAEMTITAPAQYSGRLISEISTMRGETTLTQQDGDELLLTALVPVASSIDFPMRLAMLTAGHGQLSMHLHSYRDCDLAEGKTCERRGVHPLDTAKYILAARNALDGEIF